MATLRAEMFPVPKEKTAAQKPDKKSDTAPAFPASLASQITSKPQRNWAPASPRRPPTSLFKAVKPA